MIEEAFINPLRAELTGPDSDTIGARPSPYWSEPKPKRKKRGRPFTKAGKRRLYNKKYKKSEKGKLTKAKARRQARLRKFGITSEQYNKIFELQNGKCPICLHELYKPGNPEKHRAASIEHEHGSSKRVRGLTCWRCNLYKIGTNTLDTARRVVAYLESTFDGRLL